MMLKVPPNTEMEPTRPRSRTMSLRREAHFAR
jgi:hypothetical protein